MISHNPRAHLFVVHLASSELASPSYYQRAHAKALPGFLLMASECYTSIPSSPVPSTRPFCQCWPKKKTVLSGNFDSRRKGLPDCFKADYRTVPEWRPRERDSPMALTQLVDHDTTVPLLLSCNPVQDTTHSVY